MVCLCPCQSLPQSISGISLGSPRRAQRPGPWPPGALAVLPPHPRRPPVGLVPVVFSGSVPSPVGLRGDVDGCVVSAPVSRGLCGGIGWILMFLVGNLCRTGRVVAGERGVCARYGAGSSGASWGFALPPRPAGPGPLPGLADAPSGSCGAFSCWRCSPRPRGGTGRRGRWPPVSSCLTFRVCPAAPTPGLSLAPLPLPRPTSASRPFARRWQVPLYPR